MTTPLRTYFATWCKHGLQSHFRALLKHLNIFASKHTVQYHGHSRHSLLPKHNRLQQLKFVNINFMIWWISSAVKLNLPPQQLGQASLQQNRLLKLVVNDHTNPLTASIPTPISQCPPTCTYTSMLCTRTTFSKTSQVCKSQTIGLFTLIDQVFFFFFAKTSLCSQVLSPTILNLEHQE